MKIIYALAISIFVFTSCKKADPEPTFISMTDPILDVKYDQKNQYGWIAKEGLPTIWKSSDEKVGTISADGRFSARKVGQTTVTLTIDGQTKESKVTVSPYMTFIIEPLVEFGSTIANVKSKEKRKLLQETDDLLVYEGENSKVKLISYYKQNGKITSALLLFENVTNTVMDVTTFFKERYPDNGLVGGNVVHLSDDRKYGITLSVNASLGFYAIYAVNNSGGRISNSKIHTDFLGELSKLLSE
jgi:hypothetical protein